MTRNRKNRRGKRPRQQHQSTTQASRRPASRAATTSELWLSLRQGAANVAGVRYQLAVTAWLLAHQPTAAAIVEVVPEGLEDIDVVHADGSVLHVQTKERAAGLATFGPADLVDAVAHARDALAHDEAARFVVITDAKPSRTLGQLGFDQPITQTPELVARLAEKADVDESRAASLLGRTSIVHLPWLDVGREAEGALASRFQLVPAVARVVYARLLEEIGARAADQRSRRASEALRFTRHEMEAVIFRLRELVDLAALEEVERDGLVSPLDFTRPTRLDPARFLLGVDVEPGHIAADLDVLRRDELQRVFDGLRDDRYVVVAGPSGAGKSALIWRAAHELGGRFRLLRIRAVTPKRVPDVVRYVEAQQPEEHAPILVCADDLGRPGMAGWEDLVDRLFELPGLHFLGGVRQEDHTVSLLRGRAQLVVPQLDRRLADEVVAQLLDRQVPLLLEPDEAVRRADGMLMEFLSLLTTGKRLEDVVGAQIDERLDPERRTEREVLRYTSMAHVVGLALHPDLLGKLVNLEDDGPRALQRLADEFLLRKESDGRWTGLHELRSELVTQRLHALSPMTEAQTFARLFSVIEPRERGRLVVQVALRGVDLDEIANAAGQTVESCGRAGELTSLLESWLEAEEIVYARGCVDFLRWTLPDVDVRGMLMITTTIKGGGMDPLPEELPNGREINLLAQMLPDRPPSYAETIAGRLSSGRLLQLIVEAPDLEAVEALEIASYLGAPALTQAEVSELTASMDVADIDLRGRALEAAMRLGGLNPSAVDSIAGSLDGRLERLGTSRRDITSLSVTKPSATETHVLASCYAPDADSVNEQLRSLCRLIYNLALEVTLVEAEAVRADGRRSELPSTFMTPVRKYVPNLALDTRRNVVFDEAVVRITAAESWSARLRAQASAVNDLEVLLREAPVRLLHPGDNAGRRRRWIQAAEETNRAVNLLPALPTGSTDAVDRTDRAATILSRLALAIKQLADQLDESDPNVHGIAVQLRSAFEDSGGPRRERTRLSAADFTPDSEVAEWPLARKLREDATRLGEAAQELSDLLFAVAERPELQGSRKPSKGQTWAELTADLVTAERVEAHARERASLEAAAGERAEVIELPATDSSSDVRLAGARWLILVEEDAWPSVTQRLLALDDEIATRIGFRTYALPCVDGYPFLSLGGYTVGTKDTRTHLWPLFPDDAREVATAASRDVVELSEVIQAQELFAEFVHASSAASHARIRDSRFGTSIEEVEAERLLGQASRKLAEWEPPEQVAIVLTQVADLVRRELAGDVTASLAAGIEPASLQGADNLFAQTANALTMAALEAASDQPAE